MILTRRRQQRILAEIRRALHSSDPRLVARFTLFGRLTQDEEIPPVERIRPWWLRRTASAFGRGLRAHRWPATAAGRRDWIERRLGVIVFIPAAAAVLISMPFILGRGQAAVPCTRVAPAHAYAWPQAPPPPDWTIPSCHRAGLGRSSPAGRLPIA